MSGPLQGLRAVELAGLGAAPYCAMLLAELGVEVLQVVRPTAPRRGVLDAPPETDPLHHGRPSIAVDLKKPEGVEAVLGLVAGADCLLEGFRPGVTERLGVGPQDCLAANPALVYGRLTGWGREGPLADSAGHDLNYIALSGVLHAIGPADGPPSPPLNLVADFAGGGLFLAFGLVAALLEAQRSGRGQVVDVAMVDGAASLMTMTYGLMAAGRWSMRRGSNLLDGGCPFYATYETADGLWISVAALEPQFYRELVLRIGLDGERLPAQHDRGGWPELRRRFAERFREKTRAEWCELLEGTDACFAPVLSAAEAPGHPQLAGRKTFTVVDGLTRPGPVPRFSATPATTPGMPSPPGDDPRRVLSAWGLSAGDIDRFQAAGAIDRTPARPSDAS